MTSEKSQDKLKVYYIAGNGHSGSTLLDIILGSLKPSEIFSAGELTFVTRESIFDEYCSCGNKISDCKVWTEVLKVWDAKRSISYEEYKLLRNKFERNKTFVSTLWNTFFPTESFKNYCTATRKLFEAIQTVTGKSTIVDSSKTAPRIAVLSKIVNLQIIHICRDFSGVLNSAKKSHKKDIKAGYETDLPARRTSKTLIDWILNNLLTEIFCIGKHSLKIYYKEFVNNIDTLSTIDPLPNEIENKSIFKPQHLIAGNTIRLKKELKLNPEVGFQYKRLTKMKLRFSNLIDWLLFFWVK